MLAYTVRRLLLIIPTLFGIMVVNFVIIQAAPGGPVELVIAQLRGHDPGATARMTGGGGETTGAGAGPRAGQAMGDEDLSSKYRGARGLGQSSRAGKPRYEIPTDGDPGALRNPPAGPPVPRHS